MGETIDIKKMPWAGFLEAILREMCEINPDSICIAFDTGESVGTAYFNCTNGNKNAIASVIQQDAMLEFLEVNGYVRKDEADEED